MPPTGLVAAVALAVEVGALVWLATPDVDVSACAVPAPKVNSNAPMPIVAAPNSKRWETRPIVGVVNCDALRNE